MSNCKEMNELPWDVTIRPKTQYRAEGGLIEFSTVDQHNQASFYAFQRVLARLL